MIETTRIKILRRKKNNLFSDQKNHCIKLSDLNPEIFRSINFIYNDFMANTMNFFNRYKGHW